MHKITGYQGKSHPHYPPLLIRVWVALLFALSFPRTPITHLSMEWKGSRERCMWVCVAVSVCTTGSIDRHAVCMGRACTHNTIHIGQLSWRSIALGMRVRACVCSTDTTMLLSARYASSRVCVCVAVWMVIDI